MTPAQESPIYSGVRSAVLGATGFIGRWVARLLTEAGAELHAVVRSASEAREVFGSYGVSAQTHVADLSDLIATRDLLTRLAPTIVFTLSGYGVDPDERGAADERRAGVMNVELPGTIAETMASIPAGEWRGRRVVQAGSGFEYGNIGGHLEESAAANPSGLYGRSKLAATHRLAAVCQATGVSGLTARLCQVYGPGEHPGRLLPDLIEARHHARPLHLTVGTQRKDFTYVEEAAEGLLRLGGTEGPPGEVVNLATGQLHTVREFVLSAAHLLRLDRDRLKFEKPLPDNELQHLEVATDRLRGLTHWMPTAEPSVGIRRTLDFLDRRNDG